MKITILGRGNAGCLTALHYGYYTRNLKNISIELIYDPDISPEKVGQATLLGPPELLWKALGINWYDNPIDATPKFGILYENWGNKEKSFASPFPFQHVGLHYAPDKLQEVILKSGYFSVQEKHIDNYEEIDSDFIFDCRGKPDNWDDYEELINPLNAVLLGKGKSKECDTNWTRGVATPDGWTFVIPNTTQTTSYGYLYNDKITSIKEASANFEKIFSLSKQGIYVNEEVDNLKFKNYVAKKPIIDDRIILGGNRLFFLEPLEATAVEASLQWTRKTFDWIINNRTTPALISQEIIGYIYQLQNYVMWHYTYGSKYDTPFWRAARNLQVKDPIFEDFLTYSKKVSMIDLFDIKTDPLIEGHRIYGQWELWNFKYWYDGMMD
jgi:hypothetical protein